MIIVTGGCGFIGSNLIKTLNQRGRTDIIVVDDLSDGSKFINISACEIYDYQDKHQFIRHIEEGKIFMPPVDAVIHLGACSTTTEWDGHYMMNNNYEYSKTLLHYCMARRIPFLYASSASVYGLGPDYRERRIAEQPLNVYAYSKFLFDQYVRRHFGTVTTQIVGFRYFNVYGPHEQHKGSMASVAYHFNQQIKENGVARLFQGSDGYGDGEQRRDFIYVDDAVDMTLWFLEHPHKSGIFNVGTGHSQTFNDVARAVIAWYGQGRIEYIPFPPHLKGRYQSFTEADISALRTIGYDASIRRVEQGVKCYLDWLNSRAATNAQPT
jgi:ADP-L-glycero-D-manno-heptose 6-epimerase